MAVFTCAKVQKKTYMAKNITKSLIMTFPRFLPKPWHKIMYDVFAGYNILVYTMEK